MLLVCFPTLLPMGFWLSMLFKVAQAGWSPVLFRVMQDNLFLPHVSVIFIIFLILCGLHFNHLFIWLDPEVVAHDALIATKVYLNFPFGLLEQYSFGGWNLYRYYWQKL
jgi:hypothetical protein